MFFFYFRTLASNGGSDETKHVPHYYRHHSVVSDGTHCYRHHIVVSDGTHCYRHHSVVSDGTQCSYF